MLLRLAQEEHLEKKDMGVMQGAEIQVETPLSLILPLKEENQEQVPRQSGLTLSKL